MIFTFYGSEAITVSMASNRQCEVRLPSGAWITAAGQQESIRYFRDNPELVRLAGSPRVLVESITGEPVDPQGDLLAFIQAIDLSGLDDIQKTALTIIKESMP
jgi:hypothetical protein